MSTLTSSTPPRTSHDHEKEKGPYGHRGADHSDTHVEVQSVVDDGKAAIPLGTYDPVYEAKARVLNDAINQIGMGWYQWQLFVVVGFGWASDNMWPIVTSLILPPISKEMKPTKYAALLTLAQNIGLLIGAMFWGFGCDVFGRKLAFNLTLGVTAVFGMISASSPNFAAIGVFCALWSFGVGGNLPVDSAVFLEVLPQSHQYLLTVLSIDWAFAQVLATGIAWPLLGHRTCPNKVGEPCTRAQNMGWRYFVIAMGGIALLMFLIRFLAFTIYESPKYLMGKGNDAEAVHVVQEIARRNKKQTNLTIDDLKACEPAGYVAPTSASDAIARHMQDMKGEHIKGLFASKKLALSTTLLCLIWAFIGLGFPLYNAFLPTLQEARGVDFGESNTVYYTYRNSLIYSVLGIPGAIIGGLLVETKTLGRRGVLGLSTALTGAFLYASTTARNSNALLGWNCAYQFFSTLMYAVLYSYTPEVFPTIHRGTGNAITATCNRVFGVCAPIVNMYASKNTQAPVYVSGALFLVSGLMCFLLPYEPRGKASL